MTSSSFRQVTKKLISEGKELQVGDIVDVSTWKWVKKLENNRYLGPVPEAEVKAVKPKTAAK